MAYINANFLKLKSSYLFPEIERRVQAFIQQNPGKPVIRMGIGDVTEPIVPAVIDAMHKTIDELSMRETFRGYGPHGGYPWLREAIARNDFQARGCSIAPEEVFVSDGSKPDSAHILDILGEDNTVAITDPVYPVYVDTNVMAGHTGEASADGRYARLEYLPMTAENGFIPPLPRGMVDLIYLCSPNNPTGTCLSREVLRRFVDYARENQSLIFFDAAYEAYISDPQIPHSIYEIPGAQDCAIEFRSFSKTAGFTGLRIAACIVPKAIKGFTREGREANLNALWMRRHTTKSGGVSYLSQRAAEATYSPDARIQLQKVRKLYMTNASVLRKGLTQLGLRVFGGVNSPFLWVQTPGHISGWDFFDRALQQAQVVITPGEGFGAAGEGHFRISAFNSRENVEIAIARIATMLR